MNDFGPYTEYVILAMPPEKYMDKIYERNPKLNVWMTKVINKFSLDNDYVTKIPKEIMKAISILIDHINCISNLINTLETLSLEKNTIMYDLNIEISIISENLLCNNVCNNVHNDTCSETETFEIYKNTIDKYESKLKNINNSISELNNDIDTQYDNLESYIETATNNIELHGFEFDKF